MRYVFLLLIIAASVGVFVMVILPRYSTVKTGRADIETYKANLATAQQLQESRNALVAQYNNIPKADVESVKVLLPDSVDNIRLIIQLDSLATKNGLSTLRNVDYNPTEGVPAAQNPRTVDAKAAQNPYGEFVITFETVGQYSNFLTFLSDLEQNLRLVDVTNITFTPMAEGSQSAASGMTYKVTLKTYWLKQ